MEQSPDDRKDRDFGALLRTLWGYKWIVLAATAVVATLVTLYTLKQPKVYEAVGIIEHDPNPMRPLGSEVEDVADPVGSFWSSREYFKTQNQIIASRSIAERVVERLGLHEDAGFFGVPEEQFEAREVSRAARVLMNRLTVEPVQDTRLVELRVRDQNPERATLLVNTVASVYIEKTMEDRMGSTVSALEWLGEQLDDLRNELNSSELALHEFKEEHNVLSVSMEDRQNLLAGEIQAFNEALTQAQRRRIELAARARRMRAASQDDPLTVDAPAVENNAAITELRAALRSKRAERQRLATRYGDAHPEMRAISEEVEALSEQLSQEINLVLSSAEADLEEARSIEEGLRGALNQAHNAGLQLNLREIEYQRLNRERENNEKIYQVVLERSAVTDLTRMMHTQHVRIVDEALAPSAPVSPNVPLNIALGILAGLLLGCGIGAGLHFLDRRIKDPGDVEQAGVDLLGIVPSVERERARGRTQSTGEAAEQSPDLVTYTHPMSSVAECCRAIRTNLMFMSPDDPVRSIVVTSPTPQEGKTTVASNVAISLAQSGKKVLLVDTDLRRPRVHKSYGLSNAIGVTTVIVGESTLDEAVQKSMVGGLDILPCGPVPPNPSELLHGRGFSDMLTEILSKYDRVIFDSPPLGAVTDAAVLAPQIDGAIIVVKANKTTRDGLAHALRQLSDVSGRILGVILNDVDLASRPYGDGYYQYYRYHSYSETSEEASGKESEIEAAE